jgi:sugar/nucleoside kinase (ribokinase family)
MRRMRVGILGALNIDIIIHGSAPQDLEKLASWVGPSEISCLTAGSVGYIAQNFGKLGCQVHLVSTVADDPFGKSILSSLKGVGISTEHVQIEPNTRSGIGVYMLLYGFPKRPMTYRLPTHHAWPPELTRSLATYLLDAELVHCGGYLHFQELWNKDLSELYAQAKRKGLVTSLDPQFPLVSIDSPWLKILRPILQHTDVLFLDENEALGVTGTKTSEQAEKALKEIGVDEIIVKLGEKGCTLFSRGSTFHQPAMKPAKFVDTVGAGDSFDVGYLYGRLEDLEPEESTRLAVLAAAKSIEGPGGTTAFPRIDELSVLTEGREET